MNPGYHQASSERGTVLVIVLLILATATLLSLRAVSQGTLQAKMAGAYESGLSALQAAESATDYVIDDFNTFQSELGNSTAPLVINQTGTRDTIETRPAMEFQTGDVITVTLQKQAVAGRECLGAPRIKKASSVINFARFDYNIESQVDRTANGNGGAHLYRGFTMLAPLAPGETC